MPTSFLGRRALSAPLDGWFVSPTGSSSNDGSMASPWSLTHALSHPAALVAGQRTMAVPDGHGHNIAATPVWVRGGTYSGTFTSELIGTAANPILLRAYPGERVTLRPTSQNGLCFAVIGSYTWYWGLEIVDPWSLHVTGTIDLRGVATGDGIGNRLINSVVRESREAAIGFYNDGYDDECYGCIAYNGYNPETTRGYPMYTNNKPSTGTKSIIDNIFFNFGGYGIHGYSPTPNELTNYIVRGNVLTNIGLVPANHPSASILVMSPDASDWIIDQNYTYATDADGWSLDIARSGNAASNITLTNNIFDGMARLGTITTMTTSGNKFHSTASGAIGDLLGVDVAPSSWTWDSNAHYRSSTATAWRYIATNYNYANWKTNSGLGSTDTNPGTTPPDQVIIRPNAYEPGRANIIIYNWTGASNVSVDLSSVLTVGQSYSIKNGQDFFGSRVASGIYTGGSVSLPMAAITTPAPENWNWSDIIGSPVIATGPTFQVFVVRLTPLWES